MSDVSRDTIFALSSGRPPAAIAVIRIAGPRARAALQALGVKVPEPRRVGLARFRDPASGEVIDEGSDADAPAVVTLQRPDTDDRTTEADASGFFRFDAVAPGPVRFVVVRSGWTLTTPWATI